jgi:exonuclease SbcD
VRLIHTSDWHLGRRLSEHSLLEAQAHALDQLARLCVEERVDGLLIAGDLFDRAVPPEEAVVLFSEFLQRMALDVKIPVVAISGNHDSAERLGFGAGFLARGGVHLRTRLAGREHPVELEANGERVHVYGLPYLEPARVRAELEEPSVRTHDEATAAAVREIREHVQRSGVPSVLMAHLFARGGSESPDSERALEIGGAAQVDVATLDGFTYVALGHLHAPQRVGGREDIRYSGSLLKYSVGEASHQKGVTLIELGRTPLSVREIPLPPLRDVVRLEGTLRELLESRAFASAEDAWVEAIYTDTDYLLDVAPRLRERFPHLLSARPKALAEPGSGISSAPDPEVALRDTRALLDGFWSHVVGEGEPLGEAHHALFGELVGQLEGIAVAGAASGHEEIAG